MQKFGFGHASGDDWQTATLACAAQIEPPKGANLGFVYITDALASDLENITTVLTQETGVADWIGTIGVGICATGQEYFDERAVAAMVLPLKATRWQRATKYTSQWSTQTHAILR